MQPLRVQVPKHDVHLQTHYHDSPHTLHLGTLDLSGFIVLAEAVCCGQKALAQLLTPAVWTKPGWDSCEEPLGKRGPQGSRLSFDCCLLVLGSLREASGLETRVCMLAIASVLPPHEQSLKYIYACIDIHTYIYIFHTYIYKYMTCMIQLLSCHCVDAR